MNVPAGLGGGAAERSRKGKGSYGLDGPRADRCLPTDAAPDNFCAFGSELSTWGDMLKLKLFTCATFFLVPLLAHADMADCSGVPEFRSGTSYKKDQRVYVREGGSQGAHVYRCDKESCWNHPQSNNSGWKDLGYNLGSCK